MTLVNKKDVLVTLADANFINQAKQLFASVYFKAGWAGDYLLLTSGLSELDRAWFENKGIIVYSPPLLSDKPFSEKAYPPLLFSKFYLFTDYFKKWHKVIFLDADIIVQNSLEHLLEFNGFCAAKVNDFKLRGELIDNKKFPVDFTKKYNLSSSAFSTGVFIFDTDLITNNTFTEITALHSKFNDICQYGEESILNLYFYKQWHKLPVIYNAVPWYMDATYGVLSNKFTTTIIHFLCYAVKPWHQASPYYQEWLDNFNKADKIDLVNRVSAEVSLSAKYLKSYLRFLKFKKIICWLKIDRLLGKFGLLVNKIFPKLYRLIKLKNNDPGK